MNLAIIIITCLLSLLAFYNREIFEQFKFNDGVVWDDAAIKAQVVMKGDGYSNFLAGDNTYGNRIFGLGGDDWLLGGAQADIIDGGEGTDYPAVREHEVDTPPDPAGQTACGIFVSSGTGSGIRFNRTNSKV